MKKRRYLHEEIIFAERIVYFIQYSTHLWLYQIELDKNISPMNDFKNTNDI